MAFWDIGPMIPRPSLLKKWDPPPTLPLSPTEKFVSIKTMQLMPITKAASRPSTDKIREPIYPAMQEKNI